MVRRAPLSFLAVTGVLCVGLLAPAATATSAPAPKRYTAKHPTAVGRGGAVSTVDPEATHAGLAVLRRGGNAVDAAVAAAATLGVTEPYSAGIGGGGYFVYYDAKKRKVYTLDGRETAPRAMTSTSFQDNGKPIDFNEAVTSGLSVGVPGTAATWQRALDRWGTLSLSRALRPATRVATRGFLVDETFRQQTADNQARFADFTSTSKLFLPGGQPPAVGTIFRNRDLADTYTKLGSKGVDWLYDGRLGERVVATVGNPPVRAGATRRVRSGLMTRADLKAYDVVNRRPTVIGYRGKQVYGMPPSSSGGTTVGEALNILERTSLNKAARIQAMHYYLEASALAFADRGSYVGDPASVKVPRKQLLSNGFAAERFCRIDPAKAAVKPVAAGIPDGRYDTNCDGTVDTTRAGGDTRGMSTTHLVTADHFGNVVSYTLTIEQTGGSGIVVPGRGFLLNNELTDFNFAETVTGDPNLPGPGKRPRSSMSPTIVLNKGKPMLAVGSPGGSTIITTVLQVLLDRLDLGLTLPQAIADARASQRNTKDVQAEAAFDRTGLGAGPGGRGHTFVAPPGNGEIGAAVGLEFLSNQRLLAAAEPRRRGGGSAGVVRR
ncbi:MAG: gamma-glutamyltranspeptidase / glutathione hydrolase [Actinomycetota bacterium]|nr:gamma-glutamyltranspeptidase / glutathione hydrolase [Actinomycetota bacterium]